MENFIVSEHIADNINIEAPFPDVSLVWKLLWSQGEKHQTLNNLQVYGRCTAASLQVKLLIISEWKSFFFKWLLYPSTHLAKTFLLQHQ